ncbi:MAG: O-antigen ligase domain-containing protein [Pseudomonadota bacterium]
MAAPAADPSSVEDRVVALALVGTWPVYAIGGLYVLGPVLGVMLTVLFCVRAYVRARTPGAAPPIPFGVWVWIAAMAVMLLALLMGHWTQGLSTGQTIKSTIGWAKGWALFAMFPLAGACLNIKAETVIKAASVTALISLLLTPLIFMAPKVGLPPTLFVSPLKAVGGPGPEFFAVQLYSIDPGDGLPRWRYFTPWSPAAAMIGNLYLILAIEDKRKVWRWIGIISALAIIVLSKSRLGLVAAISIWPLAWGISRLGRPGLWLTGALPAFMLLLFSGPILDFIDKLYMDIRGMRVDSSRVREALGRLALDRWRDEAPIWGHGIVESGSHYVQFMPIGSHHTWFGLLFVKGAVGAGALGIALVWSAIEFAALSLTRRIGRAALAILLLMILFTIGENLEILAYLLWPGLLVLGIAMGACARGREQVLVQGGSF